MSAQFVRITKDGATAEVAPRSVRVWLDRGWKLVEEEATVSTELEPVDEADSSEAQTEGSPTVTEPRSAPSTPAQQAPPGPQKAAPAAPAGSGQEA